MNKKRSKKRTVIIYLVLILVGLIFLVFNEYGIIKYLKLKKELEMLKNEINETELNLKVLDAEIDSLQSNLFKIEKIARERYHMMGKNEKVLRVEEN